MQGNYDSVQSCPAHEFGRATQAGLDSSELVGTLPVGLLAMSPCWCHDPPVQVSVLACRVSCCDLNLCFIDLEYVFCQLEVNTTSVRSTS